MISDLIIIFYFVKKIWALVKICIEYGNLNSNVFIGIGLIGFDYFLIIYFPFGKKIYVWWTLFTFFEISPCLYNISFF